MTEREKVVKGLEESVDYFNGRVSGIKMAGWMNATRNAITLLKAQEPREITEDEWQAWKKSKKRDPLCYMWVGDDTPIWALKPEDIHEPAYLSGQIVIFNGKPTEKQREATPWNAQS